MKQPELMDERSLTTPKNRSFMAMLGLQPETAWIAILGLVFLTTICVVIKAGTILRIAFPAGATAIGAWLYLKYPLMYVSYTWWIWFTAPFVRRLADWQAGWQDPNPILLAPFLVTFISFLTLYRHLPKANREGSIAFILPLIGIIYALLIGLIQRSPTAVVVPFLNWITPVLLGLHLFAHWRDYPIYSKTLRTTFLWGVLVTGVYGVYQYIVAPEWDTSWLINTELITGGNPEPYGMRVFSTMNSAGPFSIVMMAGLLLLFSTFSPLQFPATMGGYLSFLLTLVRSAWLGWGIGLLTLATSLKPKLQMRLMLTIVVMVLCILPLTTMEQFSESINSRFESLTDLQNDQSFNDRSGNYEENLNKALTEWLGKGLGGSGEHIDSAVLDTLFSLGWLGTVFYAGGLLLLLIKLFLDSEGGSDSFASATRGICLSIFVMLIFSSLMLGLSGAVFWGFLGIGTAANRYNQYQKQIHKLQKHNLSVSQMS
jgi:hypothetical protein